MKFLLLLLTVAFLSISTHAAEPATRQAFGPILFGDSEADAEAHLKVVLAGLNARRQESLTAADVARDFITSDTKQPPKLPTRYPTTAIHLGMASGFPLATFAVHTSFTGDMAKLKSDWEVLRDIAESKFGPPTTSTPPPELKDLQRGVITTDEWTTATGLKIVLTINVFTADKVSVNLTATETPTPAKITP